MRERGVFVVKSHHSYKQKKITTSNYVNNQFSLD